MKKPTRDRKRQTALAALRKESDLAFVSLIRRRLALPLEKRMNFLRVRLPGGGSGNAPYIDLPKMAEAAEGMIVDALEAFLRGDADLAAAVTRRDDYIDQLNSQIFRELLTFMMEDPKTITRATRLIFVGKNLERIADHATNIGEMVIFMVKGKDIRHMGDGRLTTDPAAYELPGVPWVSYFTGNGVAFHGAYWHDNFGAPVSHGCINLSPADARSRLDSGAALVQVYTGLVYSGPGLVRHTRC